MRAYDDNVPIAALASGRGALALIRTSGPSAVDLLSEVFSRPEKLRAAAGNTVIHGWICAFGSAGSADPCKRIDETVISVYRGPKSYTGEDGADISCHGGSAAVKAVLETLRRAGFQDALPGEFTYRAFMNGKIDLTQSESVMETVSARTGEGLKRAVGRLGGILAREFEEIKELLMEVLSAAELYLDYSEDEIPVSQDESAGLLPHREAAEEALKRLEALLASYRREQLYRDGALAVIAGKPNAGKSSLFNALLREDRSIVTAIPGTTRDWIEAVLSLEGIPLRLVDTAGLRAADDSVGRAEAIGMERSGELLEKADCILYVIDGEAGLSGEDSAFLQKAEYEGKKILAIWNKADISRPPAKTFPPIRISAKTGEGIDELCRNMAAILNPEIPYINAEQAGLGSERQKELAASAFAALKDALEMAGRGEPLDIIAPQLRDALNAVGEITGEISSADILEAMFSRFCVGK
jgi:tRNA modification GTPase